MNLLSVRSGSLVLLVQAAADPAMEEWDAFLDDTVAAMAEHRGVCRVLVFTAGGKPNAAQRSRSLDRGWRMNPRSPVAVVSDDRLVRGVITVFAWFGLQIRAVARDRVEAAHAHLGMTGEEVAWATAERRKLEEQLGGASSARRSGAHRSTVE